MIFDKILSAKQQRLEEKQAVLSKNAIKEMAKAVSKNNHQSNSKNLLDGLNSRSAPTVIAEVKRASPSKGILNKEIIPLELALAYQQCGASAVSVLTEEDFFLGSEWHLYKISTELAIPTLRKDFIIDSYQVYESKILGASGVLLITALLSDKSLCHLYNLITELDMTPLIEVSNSQELERLLNLPLKLPLLGINNRDLSTFETDLSNTKLLATKVPEETLIISESGISTADDLQTIANYGAHGALIGESLVTASEPSKKLTELLRNSA